MEPIKNQEPQPEFSYFYFSNIVDAWRQAHEDEEAYERHRERVEELLQDGEEEENVLEAHAHGQVRDSIELDASEEKIFLWLLATLHHYKLKGVLRVAGGWVRDKLLGKECKGMDIALETIIASEFVKMVTDFLNSIGEEVQGFASIPSDPDQSKQAARLRIFDIWVNFVNLRCEEYSDNSRIPTTQEFGTPEQDALRKDLTINSLFYNINTQSVEDWTGRGKEDLKSGKIVTPLPPKDTFMEDPLRVLRAIRFGARFEFMLDEQLKEAAACDEVKDALKTKISREHIGVEIDLMICGNQPVKAMTYISDLKLFWVVFTLHPQCEPPEGCDSDCVTYLDSLWKLIRLVGCSTFTDEQRRLSLYAAMFLPLRKTIYKDKKGNVFSVVNHIFRDSLKLKNTDAETVINIHHALVKFFSLLPRLHAEVDLGRECAVVPITPKALQLRVLTGLLLCEIKDFWRVALLMSTLLSHTDAFTDAVGEDHLNKFKLSERVIVNLGLDEVWNVQPLLNEREIINFLQLKSGGPDVSKWGGPDVRKWQRKLLGWQLAHPSGTAEEWMMEETMKMSTVKVISDTEELAYAHGQAGQPHPQVQPQLHGQPQPQEQSQPQGQPQPHGQPLPQGQPHPQVQPHPQGQPQLQEQPQPQGQQHEIFTKVSALRPLASGLNMKVKVCTSFKVIGRGIRRFWECLVGDETAIIVFKSVNDHTVNLMREGSTVLLMNAEIFMYRGSMRLRLNSQNGSILPAEHAIVSVMLDSNLSLLEFEYICNLPCCSVVEE